jgi:hypothetical protein
MARIRNKWLDRGPWIVLVILAVPVLLIAVAIFEEEVLGTSNITWVYRRTGLFMPLDWLADNTVGRLIQ